jgi:pimeloyl-ACP methyl ester carboxylesterase
MSYADVNGLSIHYQEYGNGGEPLIMLHGGFGWSAAWCTRTCSPRRA